MRWFLPLAVLILAFGIAWGQTHKPETPTLRSSRRSSENPSRAIAEAVHARTTPTVPVEGAAHAVVVRKYDIQDSSSCDLLQFIFAVKTAQYGNCRHAMVVRNV